MGISWSKRRKIWGKKNIVTAKSTKNKEILDLIKEISSEGIKLKIEKLPNEITQKVNHLQENIEKVINQQQKISEERDKFKKKLIWGNIFIIGIIVIILIILIFYLTKGQIDVVEFIASSLILLGFELIINILLYNLYKLDRED